MARKKRNWHPEFVKYMEFIVNHPNYKGMPDAFKKDGSVRWIAFRSSDLGKRRLDWWDKKREKLGIPKEGKWISKVARKIHPTGEKPCQNCGKYMKLDYVYPNKMGKMSPGAMSNAPDRFDGYHTYNLCCRSKEDTGRHKENLQRYGEDRRAYEYWIDGDWKAASWLMQVFRKNKISPDHVGPISLGFCHRPKFNPMTLGDNAAKNNRMTIKDVKSLIADEKAGEQVVSWHSKYIWDVLKNNVKSSEDAKIISKLMRENMHYVLNVLYMIHNAGFDEFLEGFLNLSYAHYSVSFENFDPKTGTFTKMVKVKGTKKQYDNNAKRYIRKSLKALEKYAEKKNRKLDDLDNPEINKDINQLLKYIKDGKFDDAKKVLLGIFQELASIAEKEFKSESSTDK